MRRNPWSILAIASVLLLSMLPAIAAAEDPTFVSGNSDCTSVGSVAGNTLTILDPVVDGTYTGSDGSQITLSNTTRRAFDFATNGALVFDVIVKGSGSNWYDYDGGSGAVRSDTDLRIPNGNKLNLVHFCYAGNNPPVANHDSASGNEDTTITGNVLTNDTDADGDALTAIKVGDPANGSVTLSANGSFSYTPNANFNGTDSFTYKANDGSADSNTATVTITVNAINDPPVATNDSAQVERDSFVDIDVLGNDTDVDGDTLSVSATTQGANGTTNINLDGTVRYTPNTGFVGSDSFDYTVSDGNGGTDTGTVSVTVIQVLCTGETVTDADGDVSGAFTRLSDAEDCKEYVLDASAEDGTVLFQPQGDVDVAYRGYLEFGGEAPPAVGSTSGFSLFLEYDPDGGDNFEPVPWCTNNVFAANGDILSADIPEGHSWCIASAYTRGVGTELVTTWQVYGEDDPKFR